MSANPRGAFCTDQVADGGQSFTGLDISGSLYMALQSGEFIKTLQVLVAAVLSASCNIFSTQGHVAVGIAKTDTALVFAWKGRDGPGVLEIRPA